MLHCMIDVGVYVCQCMSIHLRTVVSFGSPILGMQLPDADSEGTPLLTSSASASRCDTTCAVMTPECSRRTFDPNLDSKVVVRRVKIAKSQPTLSRSASDSRVGHKVVIRSHTATTWRHQCSTATEINRLTADIAAENPDLVHFQQVLNTWVSCRFYCSTENNCLTR